MTLLLNTRAHMDAGRRRHTCRLSAADRHLVVGESDVEEAASFRHPFEISIMTSRQQGLGLLHWSKSG